MNNFRLINQCILMLTLLPSLVLAHNVEVVLIDKLDGNLSGYCLDIVGGGANIDPANGMQAHTCYSYRGELGADQAIDPDGIAKGILHLTEFDLCMSAAEVAAGTKLSLEECNGSEQQQFIFAENGNINPKAAESTCLTAGQETALGRNGTSPHQIKELTIEPCQNEIAAYQQWRNRTEAD